jgi:hypothetical protein
MAITKKAVSVVPWLAIAIGTQQLPVPRGLRGCWAPWSAW